MTPATRPYASPFSSRVHYYEAHVQLHTVYIAYRLALVPHTVAQDSVSIYQYPVQYLIVRHDIPHLLTKLSSIPEKSRLVSTIFTTRSWSPRQWIMPFGNQIKIGTRTNIAQCQIGRFLKDLISGLGFQGAQGHISTRFWRCTLLKMVLLAPTKLCCNNLHAYKLASPKQHNDATNS
ncbi:hypothetical protein LX36DRAFT_329794 [Colletotrichum falcatum]|nr:hypothetical protein LX36DRAFT_329794 [Colletotrichum falcatum]